MSIMVWQVMRKLPIPSRGSGTGLVAYHSRQICTGILLYQRFCAGLMVTRSYTPSW